METQPTQPKEYNINPNHFENKEGKPIDYERLMNQFGTKLIEKPLIDRFERLSRVPLHPFLKREIFYTHRDLDKILDHVEKGKKIYLYTGRGPSTESMHLGHLLPFIFCKYMQEALDCPIVIQLTDDEKYFYQNPEETLKPLSWFSEAAIENAKDILACGFDYEKTFLFRDTDYIGHFYHNIVLLQNAITYNQVKGIFGFQGSENCGKVAYGPIQAAPCVPSSFRELFGDNQDLLCLIPCGIDQDPYFRMTRDLAPRLNFPKPCTMYSKFFPALQGYDKKMSSSDPNSAIFLTDSSKQIEQKIKKHAFSGGQPDLEAHRKLGANLEIDIPCAYLEFFLQDDQRLQHIKTEYKSGRMMTSEVKQTLIETLQELVLGHQDRRNLFSREKVLSFMSVRKLRFQ